MILKQRSTVLDPFLLKFVCHHFDSKPLRWTLRLFGLWSHEVVIRPADNVKPEPVPDSSFALHLDRLVSPVAVNRSNAIRDVVRRGR